MAKKKLKKTKSRALVLFSGGLDSRLAVKLLEEQGIIVEKVFFKIPFAKDLIGKHKNLRTIDCTKGKLFDEYITMLRKSKHGTGAGINPCIDCKLFMFNKAKLLAKKLNCDILATGEVLGQRPMSQTAQAISIIDKNVKGIKRPLIEKGIQGRSRKPQIALAAKYKISYPHPAGGCLLCEKDYAAKLRDIFKHEKKVRPEHIESLNGFRHFRKNGKIIVGRNHQENLRLESLNKKLKWHLGVAKVSGPSCLYQNNKDKKLAEQLIKAYSSKDLKKRKKFEKIRIKT